MSFIGVGLRKPEVKFIAATSAPSAEQAQTALVPDHLGGFALRGFEVDPSNPISEVRLDNSTEPPVLHLIEALTHTVYGSTDKESGEFRPHGGHMPEIAHTASGQYAGPGSSLEIN